jgi:hypothetical protein
MVLLCAFPKTLAVEEKFLRGSQFSVYCDGDDYQYLLPRLREIGPLQFAESLSQMNKRIFVTEDPALLLKFLRTKHPEASNTILVLPQAMRLNTRSIEMEDGTGAKEKASQVLNFNAVLIKLGGELSDKILVCSIVNTTGETKVAKETFAALKKLVSSVSTHVNGSFVLPGAISKLQAGWRLTPDPGFSRELDLAVPRVTP